MTRLHPFLICLLLLSCMVVMFPLTPSWADEMGRDPALVHNEVPDDPYIASPRSGHPKSPAMRFTRDSFFASQVNVDALGQNIVGDAANEPSIAVDPTDPSKMVIGWRQFDTISSNFRQAGYGYTTNGGLTWTFPGVIDAGVFRSDPVLDSDSSGKLYYNSLTYNGSDFFCDVYGSISGGMTWDSGTPAYGGDKQWMAIDKSGGAGDGHIYSNWNSYYTSCAPGFFTRSTDGNESYENCSQIPDNPYWGTLIVAPDGRLFSMGSEGSDFVVARSSNAQNSGQTVSWDFSSDVDLDGSIKSGTGPNPGGLLGQAGITTVPYDNPDNYAVCVLCSVDPPGGDPLDVSFARSIDGGLTWSNPIRVNDDTGNNWQWFSTMSASPSGRIDVVWLDTRDNPGTYLSSLYYSYSEDKGLSWSANERLSDAFDPHVGWPNQSKMGDYFDMVSDDAGFSLAWVGTFNGEQDVYFGRKTVGGTAVGDGSSISVTLLSADANPFTQSTTIRYTVPQVAFVSLNVYDILGRRVTTLVSGNHSTGSFQTQFDGRDLPAGVYFLRLNAGNFGDSKKMLLLK
jgi:hypothetical protein